MDTLSCNASFQQRTVVPKLVDIELYGTEMSIAISSVSGVCL